MTCIKSTFVWWLSAAVFFAPSAFGQEKPPQAAIASAHFLATDAGHEMLSKGGNAFDAAVAVAAVLGVVESSSSGFGGGAFFLLHTAQDAKNVFVDARETAPAGAKAADYLNEAGQLNGNSVNGPLAAGIPGQPAGLVHLAKKYGRLPLSVSLAPAIRISRDGFAVYDKYLALLGYRAEVMRTRFPDAAKIFLVKGQLPALGSVVKQPDLARSLTTLAELGHAGFYEGRVAKKMVDGVRKAGGTWTLEDLQNYQVKERTPIQFNYRGATIITSPPPSSGGIALAEMFNILGGYDLKELPAISQTHLKIEAMRRAYRDRALYLGDPDFISDMPIAQLTSADYAAGLRASIRMDKATPSASLPGINASPAGTDTSHFSIIDREGNLVSATLSVNLPYGSAFVPAGTGILLNNEMDDFSIKDGVANSYGLVGQHANSIAPGKRMLSSMTPTFLLDDKRIAVIGTPGGSRIITMVFIGLLELLDGRTPLEAVSAPRMHHQYLPDTVSLEPDALSAHDIKTLTAMGHTVSGGERAWGNMQAVAWLKERNVVLGASDPRWSSGRAVVK